MSTYIHETYIHAILPLFTEKIWNYHFKSRKSNFAGMSQVMYGTVTIFKMHYNICVSIQILLFKSKGFILYACLEREMEPFAYICLYINHCHWDPCYFPGWDILVLYYSNSAGTKITKT